MDSTQATTDQISQALACFGLREFRPAQREIIEAVLRRDDVLCVMPTGSGKSLCYQLPAIMGDGVSLVVSPLIALMKDQVDSLRDLEIAADFLNSSLTVQEQAACLDRLERGECRLLYVAPERFRSRRFIEIIKQLNLQLFAVDEAHCISEWGHDFRHDYARLGEFRAQLGNPPTIALTATATPDVQQDIVRQLHLPDPRVFVAGFKRDNLHYAVETCASKYEKRETLLQFLRHHEGAGIIYVSTRAACGDVAAQLDGVIGRKVGIYHGKLEPDERRRVQDEFMDGRTPVIVATNAFGMGIDKPNVRFVVHFNLPGTIESYYQESGRAGRDGLPSACLLLFSWQDRFIQEFFIESAYPEPGVVEQVYEYLRQQQEDPIQITQSELKDHLKLDISNEGVGTCERLLEKAGAIERLDPLRNMAIVRINSDLPTLVDVLPKAARQQRKLLQAIEQIVGDDRFESCYVLPSRLARMAEMPLNSVARLLRELTELDAVEYVPPFRGRAIRVKHRDKKFSELKLDFAALQKRKQNDYEKLEAMVNYAQSCVCRQHFVLSYFGDRSGASCGQCDNCADDAVQQQRPQPAVQTLELDAAVRKAIRIALSGVARAKGRFGKSLVAAMLAGSQSNKITRWKLDTLSTFGLLHYLTQPEITQLLDSLLRAKLIAQNEIDRFRPIVELTPTGVQVMKQDDAAISLALDGSLVAKIRAAEVKTAATDLARRAPASGDPGLVSHAGNNQSDESVSLPADENGSVDDLWTWRLLAMGFRIDECAAIRRCSMLTLCEHLARAAEQGKPLSLRWVFSPQEEREIASALVDQSGQPLQSLLSQLSYSPSEPQLLVLRQHLKSLKHKGSAKKTYNLVGQRHYRPARP